MIDFNEFLIYFKISYESLLVLIVTSCTCALISPFLVLRKLSMISDAIAHSVLLGIVLSYFFVKDTTSPILILGAGLFGVITVLSIEFLSNNTMIKNDNAIGIVFPMFFALAIILITKYASNVHVDTDVVLMGEVIVAPLNRLDILGFSIPKALWYMSILLIINSLFIFIFFKELKITTFDPNFAKLAGFSSIALFYALMTLSSLSAVTAFDSVGAMLVISFLITPGASAYLISKDLKFMIFLSFLYAIINSIIGYVLAILFNVSMSGMSATISGITFLLTFLLNRAGLITSIIIRIKKKRELKPWLILTHIKNHMNTNDEKESLGILTINHKLKLNEIDTKNILKYLLKKELIYIDTKKEIYVISDKGLLYLSNKEL